MKVAASVSDLKVAVSEAVELDPVRPSTGLSELPTGLTNEAPMPTVPSSSAAASSTASQTDDCVFNTAERPWETWSGDATLALVELPVAADPPAPEGPSEEVLADWDPTLSDDSEQQQPRSDRPEAPES